MPLWKEGEKKGRKPHPTPGTTPWKKKKEKTSTHTLRNIQTFPLPCHPKNSPLNLLPCPLELVSTPLEKRRN